MHVKVMGRTNPDGHTNGCTDARTNPHTPNCQCDNKVALTASGVDKKCVSGMWMMHVLNITKK
jgi:hypothetical protein